MSKIKCYILSIILTLSWCFILSYGSVYGTWFSLWNDNTIYNRNEPDAVNTRLNDAQYIWDPIREWAYNIVHSYEWDDTLEGIVNNENYINDHPKALSRTMQIIRNAVNRALWMLALVALVYILIQWFIILTAAWDDSKQKKWLSWIKRACFAIAWIWLSRFIVTFIFWIIRWISSWV